MSLRIPGLLPVDVYGNYTKLGFSRSGPVEAKGDGTIDLPEYRYHWTCEQKKGFGQPLNKVDIYSDSTASVTMVQGTSFDPSEQGRADFLSYVATTPFDGNDQDAARQWVRDNMNAQRVETSFGGVRFELLSGRTLRIGNAK